VAAHASPIAIVALIAAALSGGSPLDSFERLLKQVGVTRFVLSHEGWAGHQRQLLRFFKDA
jgi:hypothetical protein